MVNWLDFVMTFLIINVHYLNDFIQILSIYQQYPTLDCRDTYDQTTIKSCTNHHFCLRLCWFIYWLLLVYYFDGSNLKE